MNNIKLKRHFLVVVLLLFCSAVSYAADDLITQQITIKLESAGTLPDRIGSTKQNLITNLKIVGEINGTDLRLIREMAGRDYKGESTSGNLSILDLSEAKIVEGGSYYYWCDYKGGNLSFAYNTSNNKLGHYAFYQCDKLNDITLPSGVTSIGRYTFANCSGLTSVTIPSGVTSIGELAFIECSGLTNLTIPSSVTSIGGRAFEDCSGLTSLTIPSGVTSIGYRTFANCSGLTSVTIPSSVTSIGRWAFEDCSGLTSLTIPSGVTSINEGAFWDCSGLTSVTIPSSVTSIGRWAFDGCSSLTSVTIPSSVTSIGGGAFENCSGLTSLTIPSGVTSIDERAFSGCRGLTSLTIPSGVTSIDEGAFWGCSGLTTVYVSWSAPLSASEVFSDVSKCTLYVPQGTYQDYWLADVWGKFGKIVEYDATGIDKPTTSSDAKEIIRYSVNGQRLSAPAKGLNIVKYSDGSVKKVAVQ